jgi:hypothetical protein
MLSRAECRFIEAVVEEYGPNNDESLTKIISDEDISALKNYEALANKLMRDDILTMKYPVPDYKDDNRPILENKAFNSYVKSKILFTIDDIFNHTPDVYYQYPSSKVIANRIDCDNISQNTIELFSEELEKQGNFVKINHVDAFMAVYLDKRGKYAVENPTLIDFDNNMADQIEPKVEIKDSNFSGVTVSGNVETKDTKQVIGKEESSTRDLLQRLEPYVRFSAALMSLVAAVLGLLFLYFKGWG